MGSGGNAIGELGLCFVGIEKKNILKNYNYLVGMVNEKNDANRLSNSNRLKQKR